MPNLKEVIISLTNRCNLRCRMCDIPQNKISELSTSQWKQVIKDAASCGAEAIVFSGGEPLLRDDIFELISSAKSHSMGACLTSNGSLVDDGTANKLKQSGVDVVNISIEGPRQIHDYLRGKGNFAKARLALENLQKHKIESTVATVVSKYNYKYLPYVMDFAKAYGVTTVKFQPFNRIFLNNCRGGEDFLISDRDSGKFTEIMHHTIVLSNKYAISTNPTTYLKAIPFYLSGKCINLNKGCAALENSCPINCNGDIYPCWVVANEYSLIGNIQKESFVNIWNSLRRRSIIQWVKERGCEGCMMSCYDANFGKDFIEKHVLMNMRYLRRKGISKYVKIVLKKMARRMRFYSSYRGSFKGIFRRVRGSLQKKITFNVKADQEELGQVLKEIELASQSIERELKELE